ncbi:MAG: hypothetical protein AAFN18_12030 [Cyanobacteria bacterium J06554_6]
MESSKEVQASEPDDEPMTAEKWVKFWEEIEEDCRRVRQKERDQINAFWQEQEEALKRLPPPGFNRAKPIRTKEEVAAFKSLVTEVMSSDGCLFLMAYGFEAVASRKEVPEAAGLYAVCSEDGRKIIYIGETFNLRHRLSAADHPYNQIRLSGQEPWLYIKPFSYDNVKDRRKLEREMLGLLNPSMNIAGTNGR